MTEPTPKQLPSFGLALLPIVLTLAVLGLQIFYYGDFAPHIPLAIGIALTGLLGNYLGIPWVKVREGIFHVIHVSMPSLSILIVAGVAPVKTFVIANYSAFYDPLVPNMLAAGKPVLMFAADA